jgi:membrane peptidoglycan carboxypeptidase
MTRAEMRRAAQRSSRRGGGGGGGRRVAGGPAGPTGPPPKRLIDYPRWGKHGARRFMPSWKQLLGAFVVGLGGMTAAVGIAYASTPVPNWSPTELAQSNVYKWADGSTMATVGSTNRQNVSLDDVPAAVQHDFLAAENANFYKDSGVDFTGIARAVVHMVEGGEVQSGSTITQQFVKNSIIQNQSQSVTRKMDEILTSVKISQPGNMSKDQIFAGYLNTNYYGRGAYGIQAAARAYYGVDAKHLTLAQGAFLTSTVNEPSLYQNIDQDSAAQKTAIARWQYVLDRMVTNHWMTPQQRAQYTASAFPTPVKWKHNGGQSGQTGYMIELANAYVAQHSHGSVSDADLAKGGYTITTTFDRKKTSALTAAVEKTQKTKLSSSRAADRNVQFGGSSVDPATGQIKAIYGGPGYDKGYYVDNANANGIQVGSTFKPIVLAAALQDGAVLSPNGARSKIAPNSRFNGDDGIKIKDQNGNYITNSQAGTADSSSTNDGLLHQKNDVSTKYGYISLRQAMEMSVNTPYVQLGEYVGYQNVSAMAEKLGVLKSSEADPSAGYYIGTSTISPIRMASVYATFDNSGVHTEPYSVTKVQYNGSNVNVQTPKSTPVLQANYADTVTDVLKGVVQKSDGTGYKAKAMGPYVAGKTGTTDQYHSAWFIGYDKHLSTAITMFKEDPKKAALESMQGVGGEPKAFGGDFPASVWVDYMKGVDSYGSTPFPVPNPAVPKGADEFGAPPIAPTAPPTPTSSPSSSTSATPSGGASDSQSPTASPPCVLFCSGNGGGNGNKPTSGTSSSPTDAATQQQVGGWGG